jgi:Uma2 family endonuclease
VEDLFPHGTDLRATYPKGPQRFPEHLRETDEEPLETPWHRAAIGLLLEIVAWFLRDRKDYYAGGNMFIYYSSRQAITHEYRGPDFFFVWGVDLEREREYWLVPQEGNKYPDVIIELLSRTTAKEDRTTKKTLYEELFRTAEYFLYDPAAQRLEGWRHDGQHYQPIAPDERGWLWSEQFGLWLGTWHGVYLRYRAVWPRFYTQQGELVLTEKEAERARAEAESVRAQAEKARAEVAEAELARLRDLLTQQGISTPGSEGAQSPNLPDRGQAQP